MKHRDLYPSIADKFLSMSEWRLPLVLNEVRLLQPDVVCLQEVDCWPELKAGMAKLG